ncbi:30S ribosomal protein S15 [Candidatus Micrarchaeota archaeon]|nr:30S ribosomal protein S15 [Candidatus Micrarchaeota archaeon]
MARMHSRKRGKSGSKKPAIKTVPDWVEYSAQEVEDLVTKMGKEGTQPSVIGLYLRDKYGVPDAKVITGKSIVTLLKTNGIKIDYPEDLLNLIKKANKVRKHLKVNKKDTHNTVKLLHIECKIKRLVLYYSGTGKLPKDWKYDPEKAALLVK